MIDKRSDYRKVSIPVEMKIDGGIMPLRLSKSQLRGEDICFLTEFRNRFIEATSAVESERNLITPIDKRIVGQRFKDVIKTIRDNLDSGTGVSGRAIKPEATWEQLYSYNDSYEQEIIPLMINPNGKVLREQLQSNDADYDVGHPVEYQPILNLFEDVKLLKRFQCRFYQDYDWGNIVDYNSTVKGNPSYAPSSRAPRFPVVYQLRTSSYFEDSEIKWSSRIMIANQSYFSFTVDRNRMRNLHNSAMVFLSFTVSKSFYTDEYGASRSIYKYYTCPIVCEKKDDSSYEIPTEILLARLQTILEENNLAVSQNQHPEGHSQDGTRGIFAATVNVSSDGWGVFRMNNDLDYED